jgi:hypothetical protein
MIILFGDSWARQAYYHSHDADPQGYAHWHHKDVTVALHTDTWLNHFIETSSSLNQANPGNTTELIIQDLCHFKNISRIQQPLNYVIFQTDPLRIFAPRMDYTDYNTVWPRFREWANSNNFDLETQGISQLVEKIYTDWYSSLVGFERQEQQQQNPATKLFLVGGVSKVHSSANQAGIKIIMPSITEHFGFDQDLIFENCASLTCLIDFWCRHVPAAHKQQLRQEWWHYEGLLLAKENFWVNNPQWFAGRHITAEAMQQVARKIESTVLDFNQTDQANL